MSAAAATIVVEIDDVASLFPLRDAGDGLPGLPMPEAPTDGRPILLYAEFPGEVAQVGIGHWDGAGWVMEHGGRWKAPSRWRPCGSV